MIKFYSKLPVTALTVFAGSCHTTKPYTDAGCESTYLVYRPIFDNLLERLSTPAGYCGKC